MFSFLGGLILLLSPLSLIFLFKNRWQGFLSAITLVGVFNLSLAISSQALGVFNRPVIIASHIFFTLLIIVILIIKKKSLNFDFKFSLLPVLVFVIIIFQFLSVHYFYSGSLTTINKVEKKLNSFQPYPYFSDEWIGVAIVDKSIKNQTFFNGNPLVEESDTKYFSNLLTPFFSLIAELLLLLNLNPLSGYAVLMVIFSTLVCILAYVFLRTANIGSLASSLSVLSLPLIANSGNLPGLWSLLPLSGGLIFFLVALASLNLNKYNLFIVSAFLSLALYPPMIVFVFLSAGAYFIGMAKEKRPRLLARALALLLAIILVAGLIILFLDKSGPEILNLIKGSINYNKLDPGKVSYQIWRVLPWVTILLAVAGLKEAYQKSSYSLILSSLGGLLLWLLFGYFDKVIIISPERVIIISAILTTILSGFGWEKILNTNFLMSKNRHFFLKVLALLFFGGLSFFYTSLNNWQYFTLKLESGEKITPSPPANDYLKNDDLRIFSNIKQARFLASPWKGLTIGVTTNNFPLHSKPSFITNYYLSYWEFISSSCEKKTMLAKKHRIVYVYAPEFSCPGFIKKDVSSENLYLYQVKK